MHSPQSPLDSLSASWASPQGGWAATLDHRGAYCASSLAVMLHRCIGGAPPADRFGILMFHRIVDPTPDLPFPSINVAPEAFHAQLSGLLQRGFHFIPLRRAIEAARTGSLLPAKSVVVTFDDGFASVFSNAYPVLRKLDIPATVFLNTAFLDGGEPMPFDHWGVAFRNQAPPESYRPMTREMCRQLRNEGLVELGAHTHTHQDFRGRSRDFAADLAENLKWLQRELHIQEPTFAFPYGTPRLGFADQFLTTEARHAGVICALNTQHELASVQGDPFTWGRIHAFHWDTPATLEAKLSGWYGWIPAQRSKLQSALGRGARPSVAVSIASAVPLLPRRSSSLASASSEVDVSVIVPTYNRAHWLGGALQSLLDQQTDGEFTYEIVVVDNRSHDNTPQVVQEFAGESDTPIRYLFERSPGDAPTRNRGVLEARGNWLAFFDDDQFAEPRWLLELMRAARQSGASIVGGPVLLCLSDQELEQLGPVCRAALREIRFYDQLQPYQGKDVPGTGNALVHRSVMESVGAFDATMSAGGSDTDFFLRARRAGYQLWYAPQAAIRHRISRDRLRPAYFRWDSLSGGASHAAHFDSQLRGVTFQLAKCGLRLGHACAITAPRLAWAWLRGDQGTVLGQRTRLWRTEGYLRATLRRLAPRWFAQEKFFQWLDFRTGRDFADETAADFEPSRKSVEEVLL